MSDVTFNEEPSYTPTTYAVPKKASGVEGILIAAGVAKTSEQSRVAMIVIIISCIALSALTLFVLAPKKHPLPKEQLERDLKHMQETTNGTYGS